MTSLNTPRTFNEFRSGSVDINRLRTFVTVAREGNLTRASEILCLSQPAVSGQLKVLEDGLGFRLFDRNSRGMVITQHGKAILDKAEQAISAANQVMIRAQSLRDGICGELRIGTIAEPTFLRLGQALSALTSYHPDLRLSLLQGTSGDVVEWIIDGRIDAGYVIGEPDDPRISFIEMAPVTLRVVAPAAWADRVVGLDWSGIAELPWISTPPGCSFGRLAARMFSRHGRSPQTIVVADQEHMLRELVASGIGLTLLREDMAINAQTAGEVVIWPPGVELSHIYFVFSRGREDILALQVFLQVIRDIWKIQET